MTDLVRAKLRYHNIYPIYIPGKYFYFTQISTFPIDLIVYKPDIHHPFSNWMSVRIDRLKKLIARNDNNGFRKCRRGLRIDETLLRTLFAHADMTKQFDHTNYGRC